MGGQADVPDSAPGDWRYSPLRAVHEVRWHADAHPRLLRSARDVVAAANAGDLRIERIEVVLNMPASRWPRGQR